MNAAESIRRAISAYLLRSLLLVLPFIQLDLFGASPLFPLKVSESKRHLVDADGKPFLYHAEFAHELFAHLDREETEHYLETRRQQGFTVIQAFLMPPSPTAKNRAGHLAFAEGTLLDQPNDGWFDHVDWVIGRAREKGMAVSLVTLFMGCCAQDLHFWHPYLTMKTARPYGDYLGRKFKAHPNIIWVHGGDRHPGDRFAEIREMVHAIKSAGAPQLHTYHGHPDGRRRLGSSSQSVPGESWVDFNMVFFHKAQYPQLYRDWLSTPVKPVLLGEGTSEGDGYVGWSPLRVRQQTYASFFAGGCGATYMSKDVRAFNRRDDHWKKNLESAGAKQMKIAAQFLAGRSWWDLSPDVREEFLVSGNGFYGSDEYAVAGLAHDRTWAAVYLPTQRTVRVNLDKLRQSARAFWFDPTSGESKLIEGSPFKNAGTAEFSSTPKNASGGDDFILLFEPNKLAKP